MFAGTHINSPHGRDLLAQLHPIADLATHADTGPHVFTWGKGTLQVENQPLAGQSFEPSGKASIRPEPDDRISVESCSGGYGAHDTTQIHDINSDQRKN